MGTALGCSLAVTQHAAAQTSGNVAYNGVGPYTLTQTTPVSGGPRAIDVTVSSGDATVDTSATTVTTANNGNALGTGIAVANTGAGNVTIRNGNVTATGTGQTYAVDARTTTGTATIVNSGVIDASNASGLDSAGIYVNAGPTTITSTEVDVSNGIGISVQGTGAASITSGAVKTLANGATAINVTSDSVQIASQTIAGNGFGITASGMGVGDSSITSSNIALNTVATGRGTSLNGWGISAIESGAGNMSIASGTIAMTGAGNTFGIQSQVVGGGSPDDQ